MKNIHLYDYGKKEKNNRKLGHITITEDKSCVESGKIDKLRERIYKIKKIISLYRVVSNIKCNNHASNLITNTGFAN